MDIYCPKCGDPTELDYLHDVAEEQDTTFEDVSARFRTNGCEALGSSHSEPSTAIDRVHGLTAQDAAEALYDILGDDMDGAAAMLEDMGFG